MGLTIGSLSASSCAEANNQSAAVQIQTTPSISSSLNTETQTSTAVRTSLVKQDTAVSVVITPTPIQTATAIPQPTDTATSTATEALTATATAKPTPTEAPKTPTPEPSPKPEINPLKSYGVYSGKLIDIKNPQQQGTIVIASIPEKGDLVNISTPPTSPSEPDNIILDVFKPIVNGEKFQVYTVNCVFDQKSNTITGVFEDLSGKEPVSYKLDGVKFLGTGREKAIEALEQRIIAHNSNSSAVARRVVLEDLNRLNIILP